MPLKYTAQQEWILKYLADRRIADTGGTRPNLIGEAYEAAHTSGQFQGGTSWSAWACARLKRLVKDGLVEKHPGGRYEFVPESLRSKK